uniref:Uncharacterized protein n=1 Tax=mine drainage metagenome TaxID=410659 RepID=E6PZ96_9ZZZZ
MSFGFNLGPFTIFYGPIMLIALVFGLRSGLVSTLSAAVLAAYWILPPIKHFSIAQRDDRVELAFFVLIGIFISVVSERYVRGRKLLDAALASMTDVLFVVDGRGRLVKFNRAFIAFHKFRRKGDCPPRTLVELQAYLDMFIGEGGVPVPLEMRPVARALNGEVARGAEYTLRRKDTGETWVGSYNFSPIHGNDNTIVGAVISAQDITERKQAESILRASEIRYRSAFQTSLDGMMINRFPGGKFIEVNQTFLDITGYTREEVIGRTTPELGLWTNPRDREHLVGLLQKKGSCRDFQAQFRKKTGDTFWGIMSSSTLNLDTDLSVFSVLRGLSP